jgi:hypothetical protein
MFIAALFTIAKLWKQTRCSTTGEWIKTMCYLYTMEFYSAMKKNEMLSFAGKRMEPENIILNEVSQAQKTKNRAPARTPRRRPPPPPRPRPGTPGLGSHRAAH